MGIFRNSGQVTSDNVSKHFSKRFACIMTDSIVAIFISCLHKLACDAAKNITVSRNV